MKNFRLDDESGHQEALFSWAGYNMGRMPELEYMHHVPNGGKRDRATAVALKRQGVKAGVPDIVLPAARAGYHGLYIELKAGKNTTTENQRRWLEYLRQQGYYTAVCYGWQKAAELDRNVLAAHGRAGRGREDMAQIKKLTRKIKEQCRTCGEFQKKRCRLGHNAYCYRKSQKKCGDYQKVSITQAAKELADVAGIDINKMR